MIITVFTHGPRDTGRAHAAAIHTVSTIHTVARRGGVSASSRPQQRRPSGFQTMERTRCVHFRVASRAFQVLAMCAWVYGQGRYTPAMNNARSSTFRGGPFHLFWWGGGLFGYAFFK